MWHQPERVIIIIIIIAFKGVKVIAVFTGNFLANMPDRKTRDAAPIRVDVRIG